MPNFDRVTEVELSEIRELRSRRYGRKIPATAPLDDITGLTFSGGGIRSATFCLGVLQGLATYGLLKHFDYISTVSGGGYIASWLISWIKRPGKETRNLSGIEFVEEELRKAPPEFAPDKVEKYEEPGAINFLRSYSNYLTPRLGIFGADTWTAVASYFRNLLLNQAILISSLAAGLLLPWLLQISFKSSYCMPQVWALILIAFAGALMLLALAFVDLNIADFSLREAIAERDPNEPPSRSDQTAASQKQVLWFAVLPIGAAAVIGALGVWRISSKLNTCWWLWMVWGALGYFLLRFVSLMLAWLWLLRKPKEKGFWKRERAVAKVMLPWAPVAGVLCGVLLRELTCLFRHWNGLDSGRLTSASSAVASFGAPLLIVIILLTGVLHVGLQGLQFPNQRKEWWARLAAWLLICTAIWALLFATAIYSPLGVLWLSGWLKVKISMIAGWAATTVYGVLAGKSPKTSGKNGSRGLELVAKIAPYVFIAGTLVLISYGIHVVPAKPVSSDTSASLAETQLSMNVEATYASGIPLKGSLRVSATDKSSVKESLTKNYWTSLNGLNYWQLAAWLGGLSLVAGILAWRVDLNEFSFHLFYRNRLVRCYLGATNPARCPHPFTGFDPSDDILLQDFSVDKDPKYSGPYPILNAALNISHGQRLAWQERKAESFVFTPRYCGFNFQEERKDKPSVPEEGYRETCCYGYPKGAYLGTAVAASGAAVNPNMGYHASSAVAFLLTLFNVRLGWWMGNPRRETWTRSTPHIGLLYLLGELFGVTDDTSRYINLSDGWHFENLGIYELVRRKCKYIVCCDVGADADFGREDLGNAVRKCRSDFGVQIDLDVDALRPRADSGFSHSHCVVGEIRYPGDPGGMPGRILYIKSSLTGEEPQDVLAYKVAHPDFPHQGTGDQWFNESQFESYRALGRFAVEAVLQRVGEPKDVSSRSRKEVFDLLSRI